MKKIIAVIVSVVLSVALFSACGKVYRIQSRCPIDDESLELKIPFQSAWARWDGTGFTSELSLEEIKEEIDSADFGSATVSTAIYGDVLLLEERTKDGSVHFFCVEKSHGDAYLFIDMTMGVDGYRVQIPRHLISYSAADLPEGSRSSRSIDFGQALPTSYSMTDFVNFYEKAGIYEISVEEDYFSVQVKDEAVTKSTYLRRTFLVQFGNSYVRFSLASVEE